MSMDKLYLEVRKFAVKGFEGQAEEIAIFVNGRNLIDILREFELPMAAGEGHADIAGGYMGLPPEHALPPSRHFLGEPEWEVYRNDEKVSLLECTCGVPGCWPFLVKITVEEERVVWSNFEQPHRREDHPNGGWSYAGLGPFSFALEQYMAALRDAQSLR